MINDVKYECRSLTGGSAQRGGDVWAGGTPTDNEWDRFIIREKVITGFPTSTSSGPDTNISTIDRTSAYSKFWDWGYVYSQCQGTYENDVSSCAYRGYHSARYWTWHLQSSRYVIPGFRPVLKTLNTNPPISDTDRDLGDKNINFTVGYIVNGANAGDVLTATECPDAQKTKSFALTRKVKDTTFIPVGTLSLGRHTVKVEANDGQEGKANRIQTFRRTSSTSTISGTDTNLRDKNLGFIYEHMIDDADGDELTVAGQLNDGTLHIINNALKKETLSLTIDAKRLYSLGLNTVSNIVITVTGGEDGAAYRRLTFKRTDSAPVISGQDRDVGLRTEGFSGKYTANGVESDSVVATEFMDDKQIGSYRAMLSQEGTIELSRENRLVLTDGDRQLRIEAIDGNFVTSVRVFASQKKETVICFQLLEPEETDAMATKVFITPTWVVGGAAAKVETCSDAFDDVLMREGIMMQVMINRVFMLQNKTKAAKKWSVGTHSTITENEGYKDEVSISDFGGAYE